jgi:hypothetical protein
MSPCSSPILPVSTRAPFIERAGWRFAKSVPDKPQAQDPDFRRFAELIESEGYRARFEGASYRYLRVGRFVFWTSRSLWTPGQNINRRPVDTPTHTRKSR